MSKKNAKKNKPLLEVKKRFALFTTDSGMEEYEFGKNEIIMFEGVKDWLSAEFRIVDLRTTQWAIKAKVGEMTECRVGWLIRIR